MALLRTCSAVLVPCLLAGAAVGVPAEPGSSGDRGSDGWMRLAGHAGPVQALTHSPDGTLLASGDEEGEVRLRDAFDGAEVLTMGGHAGRVNALAFSPDGARLAVAGGSPRRLVGGGAEGFALVRDAHTGAVELELVGPPGAHARMVLDMAWSTDGARLATAGNDATVRVWDAATGAQQFVLDATQPAWAVAFAPDGRTLAASGGNTVYVFDLGTGARVATLTGHTRQVTALAFTPDGEELVSAALDHRLRVWDPQSGLRRRAFEALPAAALDFALSPDGRFVAPVCDDPSYPFFDLGTKRERARLAGPDAVTGPAPATLSVSWSPDGRSVAFGLDSGIVLVGATPEGLDEPRR